MANRRQAIYPVYARGKRMKKGARKASQLRVARGLVDKTLGSYRSAAQHAGLGAIDKHGGRRLPLVTVGVKIGAARTVKGRKGGMHAKLKRVPTTARFSASTTEAM